MTLISFPALFSLRLQFQSILAALELNFFPFFLNIKSEAERDSRYSTKFNNRKTPDSALHARRESGLVRTRSSSSNALKQTKGLRDRSTHRLLLDSSDNCDVSVVRALNSSFISIRSFRFVLQNHLVLEH